MKMCEDCMYFFNEGNRCPCCGSQSIEDSMDDADEGDELPEAMCLHE